MILGTDRMENGSFLIVKVCCELSRNDNVHWNKSIDMSAVGFFFSKEQRMANGAYFIFKSG